jgi:CRISPR-associated endonuclease Csn1
MDAEGKLREKVVSFRDAVERVNQELSPIDYDYNKSEGWQFLFTMKQNEIFVFPNEKTGFNPNEIDLMDNKNYQQILPNMFRVQSLSVVYYGAQSVKDFIFRHVYETTVTKNEKSLFGSTYRQLKSFEPLRGIVKIRINHLGDIVHVGEY